MIPTLIVDRDPQRLALYEALLARHFSLFTVPDASVATEAARQSGSVLILVCADACENPTGPALCLALQDALAGTLHRILLIGSGLDEEVLDRETARQMGADALVGLPLTPERLKRALKPLLAELAALQKAAPAPPPEAPTPPPLESASATPPPVAPPSAHLLAELGITPEVVARLDADELARLVDLFGRLEREDYYRLLGCAREASGAQVRRAYFSLARFAHPDRYTLIASSALSRVAGDVFKRLTEAYQALSDPEKRRRYDQQLAMPSPELRLTDGERGASGPRAADRALTNPQARKFFNLAQAALTSGDLKSAKMNFTFALKLEPAHPLILEQLDAIKKQGA